MRSAPMAGEFVEARGRLWLVEEAADAGSGPRSHLLACVDDDAQGRPRVLWRAEIGAHPVNRAPAGEKDEVAAFVAG